MLHGRFCATCDDIRAVAHPVLRHRILTNFNAEAEGIKSDQIVDRLIDTLAAEEGSLDVRGKLPPVLESAGPGPA